ncbi:hypothetical protein NO1_0881, partial [Candidatus Termititenax aidoneus]
PVFGGQLHNVCPDRSSDTIVKQLCSTVSTVNAAMDKADYTTAEKQLAEILPLFDQLDISKQTAASLKYKAILLAIEAAERLQDNLKIIEYCTLAVETCAAGVGISLEIFRKRGEAYLAVDETDQAWADFSFYKKEMAVYDCLGETLTLQEQIEKLLPELYSFWLYCCCYLADKNTADIFWSCLLKLAKLWDDLE